MYRHATEITNSKHRLELRGMLLFQYRRDQSGRCREASCSIEQMVKTIKQEMKRLKNRWKVMSASKNAKRLNLTISNIRSNVNSKGRKINNQIASTSLNNNTCMNSYQVLYLNNVDFIEVMREAVYSQLIIKLFLSEPNS